MKRANKNIGVDAAYAELYAECMDLDVDTLFSPAPLKDDPYNWHNPVGNLKDNVDTALNIIGETHPRNVEAIVLRYGLDGNGQRTLDETGASLAEPVSRERVRQLICKGIRMLHHPRCTRAMTGRVKELRSNDNTPNIYNLMLSVNINKMTDPHDIQLAVGKFATEVLPKVTVGELINTIHVSMHMYNCMARSGLLCNSLGEILLAKHGFDFSKIRNCGRKTIGEIQSVIASWASNYLGEMSYGRLVSLLRPFVDEKLMSMTKIYNSLITVPTFRLGVSTVSYNLLTVNYGCDSLFDVVAILNDDAKFMNLCNDQELYNDVMSVIDQHCSTLGISIDQLQTVVKDIDIIWSLYSGIFNASSPAIVDLHTIVKPSERRRILRNFIDITITTSLDEIGIPDSTRSALIRGLRNFNNTHCSRNVIRDRDEDVIAELLVYNNGVDLTRLRGFGQKKADTVKSVVSKWASKLLGDVTYDELVDMLSDVARNYVHTELVRRTHALAKSLYHSALRDNFDEHVESVSGTFCKNPVVTHERMLYFSNVLHCYSIYDLFKVATGGVGESTKVRTDDEPIINGILDEWCEDKNIDKETIIKCFLRMPISNDMEMLRKIDGKLIHQYFTGPNSEELKNKYNKCTHAGFRIWEVADGTMHNLIKKWLEVLTPGRMNRYWGLSSNQLSKGGGGKAQLEWANNKIETKNDIDTVMQLQRIFSEKGYTISLGQATFLWVSYSVKETKRRKDWAPATNDDEMWLNVVAYVFDDRIMLNEMCQI